MNTPSRSSIRTRTTPVIVLGLGFALALLPAQAGETGVLWLRDFDMAVEQAREQGKDLLVAFVGSDWCPWSRKLEDEVFSTEMFLKAAPRNLVLVTLDFPHGPRGKTEVPNAERNEEIADRYGVSGFPTVLLMTVDGDVYGSLGYSTGGALPFMTRIERARSRSRVALMGVMRFVKGFDSLPPGEKPDRIRKAIGMLTDLGGDGPGSGRLARLIRKALEIDPKDETRLKREAVRALLRSGFYDAGLDRAAREVDAGNVLGILELAVNAQCEAVGSDEQVAAAHAALLELDALGPLRDPELAVSLYANAAFWNYRILDDLEEAQRWAGKAKEVGVTDADLADFLDRVLRSK